MAFFIIKINILIIGQLFDVTNYVLFSKTGFDHDISIFSSPNDNVHKEHLSSNVNSLLLEVV